MNTPARLSGFNPTIHGLRGFAALMVFFYHIYAVGIDTGTWGAQWPEIFAWFGAVGRYGVELFFMISGYLITDTLARKGDVRSFLIDRAIRLHPAFLGVVVPMFGVGMLFGLEMFGHAPTWSWPLHFISNVLFLPGVFDLPAVLPVAWTLSFELAFYLTAAGALTLTRRGYRAAAFAVCIVSGFLLFPRAPGVIFFFVGAAICLYRESLLATLSRLHYPSIYLVVLLLTWHIVIDDYHRVGADLGVPMAACITISALSGALLFNSISLGRGVLSAAMRTRFMQFFGTISYSFYLWHVVVMYAFKYGLLPALPPLVGNVATLLLMSAITLLGSVLISWASYAILERQAGAWLRRRMQQRAQRTLSVASLATPSRDMRA